MKIGQLGGISTNKLRLFGSIALLVVLIIAYISTNFALKIQYVILGLIVLSLGSIFLGSSKGLKVGSDIIESPSFATLFGLFFPAVTGFTAGVAMSGDLKIQNFNSLGNNVINFNRIVSLFNPICIHLL